MDAEAVWNNLDQGGPAGGHQHLVGPHVQGQAGLLEDVRKGMYKLRCQELLQKQDVTEGRSMERARNCIPAREPLVQPPAGVMSTEGALSVMCGLSTSATSLKALRHSCSYLLLI